MYSESKCHSVLFPIFLFNFEIYQAIERDNICHRFLFYKECPSRNLLYVSELNWRQLVICRDIFFKYPNSKHVKSWKYPSTMDLLNSWPISKKITLVYPPFPVYMAHNVLCIVYNKQSTMHTVCSLFVWLSVISNPNIKVRYCKIKKDHLFKQLRLTLAIKSHH